MRSWEPSAARNSLGGLADLCRRQEWRESAHGEKIAGVVRAALHDDDAVNRLHAAHAVRRLEPHDADFLALVRQLLLDEADDHVEAELVGQLATLAPSMTSAVDSTIGELVATDRWQARLGDDASTTDATVDPLIDLVLYLAIVHQAPNARATAWSWMTQPAGPAARHAFWLLGRWLAVPANRTSERRRAFQLVLAAAQALAEHGSSEAADASHILQAADSIASAIYGASGAFGANGAHHEPVAAEPGFAEEAFPVIELLTEFKYPPITHHLVQTLGHLAPADPIRSFLLIERAIRAGDAYTYDSLAADTTIGLIERYLAEFRDVVTTQPDLLTAVRKVLDAFVRVGWPAAVSLSYRLGDAFR